MKQVSKQQIETSSSITVTCEKCGKDFTPTKIGYQYPCPNCGHTMIEAKQENEVIKCPGCPCIFLTVADRDRHLGKFGFGTHNDSFRIMHKQIEYGNDEDIQFANPTSDEWIKSKFDESWVILAEKKPQLAMACRSQSKVQDGMFKYKLCGVNGKWLKKTPI